MNKFFFLFLAIYANFAFGQVQNSGESNPSQKIDSAKSRIEIIPEFPGGSSVFRNKIAENFIEENVKGDGILTCEIIFVINKEGVIDEIITKGTSESFNIEAKRAVSQIKDLWTPATVNGEKVRYRMRIPLTLDYTEYKSPENLKNRK